MKPLFFVTQNKNKFEEARNILTNYDLRQIDIEVKEIRHNDIVEIAKHSLVTLQDKYKKPIFVEDSGLFINALKGFPGPYSSFVQRKIGNEGILKLMNGAEDRTATFKSAIAFCTPDNDSVCFLGETPGNITTITTEERGTKNFSYDPIFVPLGEDRTFGEMIVKEKNEFSHRGKALQSFKEWLTKNYQ